MGIFSNNNAPYTLFKRESILPYFIDKTELINELFSFVGGAYGYLCITRPRRFGKTMIANMLSAYFGRGKDSSDIFDQLMISASENYRKHLPIQCNSYFF